MNYSIKHTNFMGTLVTQVLANNEVVEQLYSHRPYPALRAQKQLEKEAKQRITILQRESKAA